MLFEHKVRSIAQHNAIEAMKSSPSDEKGPKHDLLHQQAWQA